MEAFKEALVIWFTAPVYIVLIGAELLLSHFHHKKTYTFKDTLINIYLSLTNMGIDVLVRGICLLILDFFFTYRFAEISNPYAYWFLLFILQDFAFYVLHYVDHNCRLFWAVHVTHHSSEEFNLTVGFRSSVLQPLYRFAYYIPLACIGFKGMDIMLMYSVTQIYGVLIHTKFIGKLGFLEWFLATPSHHRVHHASNPQYLDKNMGMVLIIWDRIFGTFTEEKEEVKYGLTKNIQSYHPLTVIFHEWKNIIRDFISAPSWKEKFLYVFGPPGWSHDGRSKTSRQLREEYKLKKNI